VASGSGVVAGLVVELLVVLAAAGQLKGSPSRHP
jgi:hypothetical protein